MKKEHVLHKSLSSDNLSYKSMCNGQLKTWGMKYWLQKQNLMMLKIFKTK